MKDNKTNYIVFGTSALFLAFTSFFIARENYIVAGAFPLALSILWMYTFKLDWCLYIIAFLTPLSIDIEKLNLGFSISFPSEPLLVGLLGIFLLKILFEGNYNKDVLKHPITILIILHLSWLLITSFTSEFPLVSFKRFLTQLWFITPIYFIGILVFRKVDNIEKFQWFYLVALFFVIFHTTRVHAMHGFSKQVSHWAMSPFYNDHTAYGAILALLLPFTILSSLFKGYSRKHRICYLIATAILMLAFFLSSSRAAWLSFVIAFGALVILLLKIKFRYVIAVCLIIFGTVWSLQDQIFYYLNKNTQESSNDFKEHVKSAFNISTDPSNVERINRWASAIRLTKERPITGWGPGTYQFVYAPFQRAKEKTVISTNFGDVGGAHSEYLTALSESGIPSLIFFTLIALVALNRAYNIFKKTSDKHIKLIALYTFLGLITYLVHGFLNYFLDTDKLSVPFWAYIAIIASIDVFHYQQEKNISNRSNQKLVES